MTQSVVQDKVSQALVGALRSAQQRGVLKLEQMPMVNLEAPKRPEWGDVSCTVAMSLSASERRPPFDNMGAQLSREVAASTSEMASDGTTTATVLAHAMIREGSATLPAA